jgi:hypothetical protein
MQTNLKYCNSIAPSEFVIISDSKRETYYLMSLNDLYNSCNNPEVLIDGDNLIYGKMTDGELSVMDKGGGFTKINRIIKRYNQEGLLKIISLEDGDDIMLNKNHSLLLNGYNSDGSDSKDVKISAMAAVNNDQYNERVGDKFFQNCTNFKVEDLISELNVVKTGDFILHKGEFNHSLSSFPNNISMGYDFGYLIGAFIAFGEFSYNSSVVEEHYLTISATDKNLISRLQSTLYSKYAILSMFDYDYSIMSYKWVYKLKIESPILYDILYHYFKINDMQECRAIPYNIFKFNEKFFSGILNGIIDFGGVYLDNELNKVAIITKSRYLVSSLAVVLNSLHYSYIVGYNELTDESSIVINIKPLLMDKVPGWVPILDISDAGDSWTDFSYGYDIETESETFLCNNILVK